MKNKKLVVSTATWIALSFLLGCRSEPPTQPQNASPATTSSPPPTSSLSSDGPRLILFLVVDQARVDYLERFRPLLRYGLDRLLRESVAFTDANHDHASTSTAPGHATLATGRHPAGHGIVSNDWFDRGLGREVYAVLDDEEEDVTPERLLAPAFGDWLKTASPGSKVFAASGKDRAAVLSAGRLADGAFWFDHEDTGDFVTSPYYPKFDRPWLAAFHRDEHCHGFFGDTWTQLPEVSVVAAEYALEPLDEGLIPSRFPRPLGRARLAPGEDFYEAIYRSPYLDAYLGRFARALIEGEELGRDQVPDWLGLSFSALDTVGHRFGPDSPEFLDTLLRLDQVIGELLDFVDATIGLEHVVVSLSSDHGVTPIPEVLQARGVDAARFGGEEIACFQKANRKLREQLGDGDWVIGSFYIDRQLAAEQGVELQDIENILRRHLESCPRVVRVLSRGDLDAASGDDRYARLYRNNLHGERSPDIFVQLEPHTLTSDSSSTNHGSPHAYDTAVPWLLRLSAGTGAFVGERVHTVDVAPTLAALIGLEAPAEVDGVDRTDLF